MRNYLNLFQGYGLFSPYGYVIREQAEIKESVFNEVLERLYNKMEESLKEEEKVKTMRRKVWW